MLCVMLALMNMLCYYHACSVTGNCSVTMPGILQIDVWMYLKSCHNKRLFSVSAPVSRHHFRGLCHINFLMLIYCICSVIIIPKMNPEEQCVEIQYVTAVSVAFVDLSMSNWRPKQAWWCPLHCHEDWKEIRVQTFLMSVLEKRFLTSFK